MNHHSTAPTREEFHEKYRPYWEAPTAKLGLRNWKMSIATDPVDEDGSRWRECFTCHEEFPLEEFWTGTKLSYYCERDRGKSKSRRRKIEQQVAKENEEMTPKNPVSKAVGGVKDKVAGSAKSAIAAPAAKMAGRTAGKAASNLLGDEAGEVVGKLAEQTVKQVMA